MTVIDSGQRTAEVPTWRWLALRTGGIVLTWMALFALYRWVASLLLGGSTWALFGVYAALFVGSYLLGAARRAEECRHPFVYSARLAAGVNTLQALGLIAFGYFLAVTTPVPAHERDLTGAIVGAGVLAVTTAVCIPTAIRVFIMRNLRFPAAHLGPRLFAIGSVALLFHGEISRHSHEAITVFIATLIFSGTTYLLMLLVVAATSSFSFRRGSRD